MSAQAEILRREYETGLRVLAQARDMLLCQLHQLVCQASLVKIMSLRQSSSFAFELRSSLVQK